MAMKSDVDEHRPRVLFFGCWDEPGHYLHDEHGRHLWREGDETGPFTWSELDGSYAPRDTQQKEGRGCLHHVHGWTVFAFWDRTVDKRRSSNAAFLAEGTYTFEEMLELAKSRYPDLWVRFDGRLRLVLAADHVEDGAG